jgi:hypothetical protein
MSWKGLKKAVNRLPHLLQVKTGSVQQSELFADPEFDNSHTQFDELQQLSSRLADAAKKYQEALQSMLKHQEQFSRVLMEVYEPIPGKYDGQTTGSSGGGSGFGNNGGVGGLNSKVASLKRQRAQTAESSIKRAQLFQQACNDLCQDLTEQIVCVR